MSKTKVNNTDKMIECPDCELEYVATAPHNMFCPAKTCTECMTTFSYVIPIYDSRPEAKDEDGNPPRLCDNCLNDRLDDEEKDDE